MAGSFGFEKEHYDVSMAIGRRRLFPAVEKNPDAIIVAPGISCRQQVEHATGRRVLHPAEALDACSVEAAGRSKSSKFPS